MDFGDVDPSDVCIESHKSKREKLNNFKINIHVWKKEQIQSCCYNVQKVLADETINVLLVVESEGQPYYFHRLYFIKK